MTANINTAAVRGYHDRNSGGWPVSFYDDIGLDDVFEKLAPETLDLGTAVEGPSREAAVELGLKAGMPVAQGGGTLGSARSAWASYENWQGNRTPCTDPLARGMVWGLSLHHTPERVYRAIQEGVCCGTAHILRAMQKAGFKIDSLVAAGGFTNSPQLKRMHADVSGLPITSAMHSSSTPTRRPIRLCDR
jgi:ribulose kinase